MTLPASGSISMSQVRTELSDNGSIDLKWASEQLDASTVPYSMSELHGRTVGLINKIYFYTDWIMNRASGHATGIWLSSTSAETTTSIRYPNVMTPGRKYRLNVKGSTNNVSIGVWDGFMGATSLGTVYGSNFNFTKYFTCKNASTEPGSLQFDFPTVSPRGVLTLTSISLTEDDISA